MKLSDFVKLKKLMAATASTSDGEALNALRAANKMLVANNLDWPRVLDRVCHVMPDVESAPEDASHRRDPEEDSVKERVEAAFEVVGVPDGTFGEMILSFRRQWDERGTLSPKQRQVLFDAAKAKSR